MKFLLTLAAMIGSLFGVHAADKAKETGPMQFKMKDIDGKEFDLATLKGKVVLFVNVASKCGYTKQYAGLEKLYKDHKDAGLVIVGVPANEFGKQEPGTDAEIKEFCSSKYNVTFPMMGKVVVKGNGIDPLYKHLTEKETNPDHAGEISWNFEKFLVNRKGQVVQRYKSKVAPESEELIKAIKTELHAK